MMISGTPFRISFVGGGIDHPDRFREHAGAVPTVRGVLPRMNFNRGGKRLGAGGGGFESSGSRIVLYQPDGLQ